MSAGVRLCVGGRVHNFTFVYYTWVVVAIITLDHLRAQCIGVNIDFDTDTRQ